MKKILFFTLILIFIISFLLLNVESKSLYADEVIYIPDPNLEAVLREALGKPIGEVTRADLESLTSLNADDKGIANLSGLEYATNLTHLYLDGNQISELSPLSGLTNLVLLSLQANQISDISELSGLINLQLIWIMRNQITDLSPLSGLTNNLVNLHFGENQISDLSPLSGLTNLEAIHFGQNQISDLSPLSGLTNLIALDLRDNQISDLSPLSGLTKLEYYLRLGNNQISDLSPLSGLVNLGGQGLSLYNNQIYDISALVINSQNGGLGQGDSVRIQYNFLDLSDGSKDMQDIQTLINNGIEVNYYPQGKIIIPGIDWDGVDVFYFDSDSCGTGYSVGHNDSNDEKYLGEMWQCVELARRFCYEKYQDLLPPLPEVTINDEKVAPAFKMWDAVKNNTAFYRVPQGGDYTCPWSPPQFGDVIVFNNGGGWNYGHLAVVKEVTGDIAGETGRVHFVQQNVCNGGSVAIDSLKMNQDYSINTDLNSEKGINYPPVLGWIRSAKNTSVESLLISTENTINSQVALVEEFNVDIIDPGDTSIQYNFENIIESRIHFVANWEGSSLRLNLYRPDGTLFDQVEGSTPPIEIIVENAGAGTWSYEVMATDVPHEDYIFIAAIGRLSGNTQTQSFVSRFYEFCIGRSPDIQGLNYWCYQLTSEDSTAEDVGYGFAMSQEYIDKATSNTEFTTMLYNVFLDRPPDSGGLSFWVSQLETAATRPGVLNGFIHSTEFSSICDSYGITPFTPGIPGFVTRFYTLTLERVPDIQGRNYWVNLLETGEKTGEDIAYGFIFSDEFLAHNHPNSTYVSILYNAFFDRVPDTEGYIYWMAMLGAGYSREYVLDSFIHSVEFEGICGSYGIEPY